MKTAKELELNLLVKEKTISDLKYELMKKEQEIQEIGEQLLEYREQMERVRSILERKYVDIVLFENREIKDIKKLIMSLLKVKK